MPQDGFFVYYLNYCFSASKGIPDEVKFVSEASGEQQPSTSESHEFFQWCNMFIHLTQNYQISGLIWHETYLKLLELPGFKSMYKVGKGSGM